MPRKPTKPQPDSGKKLYGIRLQSLGPSGGFHFNLPEGHGYADGSTRLTLEELVRRTAKRSGQSERKCWEILRVGGEVLDEMNIGLAKTLSIEEAAMLQMLIQLTGGLSVEDMRELIRQIRSGPVDRFFPLEEVSMH